jgi:hypothetical protein
MLSGESLRLITNACLPSANDRDSVIVSRFERF